MKAALGIIQPKVGKLALLLAKKAVIYKKSSCCWQNTWSTRQHHFFWIKICKLGIRNGYTY